jgi:hypothetical protein
MKRRKFIQDTGTTAIGGTLFPSMVPSIVLGVNSYGKLREETPMDHKDFIIEALSDFPDDARLAPEPIGSSHIDSMMQRLTECGVRRVSWGYYGDGRGGFLTPAHEEKYEDPERTYRDSWKNVARTYQELGQNPLATAVQAAHKHGLEIYAYFKPYETGLTTFPEGSYEAALYGRLSRIGGRIAFMNPFVADHPHLRIKRRDDDLPSDLLDKTIDTIKLRKRDASPTRITREHMQIWVSDLNYKYRRVDIPFSFTERIEPCPEDVYEITNGEILVKRGDPQRVLILSGLCLRDKFVLVTTDFTDANGDFENTDLGMLEAYDENGQKITGVIASRTAIFFNSMVDFRQWGLMFDTGYNGRKMHLDDPVNGFVAFARGRNEFLTGALCETEPQVQEFWLSCLEGILDQGVDGIDFREENHSTHTNHPEEYGFNEVVLEKCRRRGGIDLPAIAKVRGDAYTEFLRRAKQLINSRGKKMRINFQIDWYRTDPPRWRRLAYPANLDFQWKRWIEEGLTDEAVLRFYALPFNSIFEDEVAQGLISRCGKRSIPVTVNRYIGETSQLTQEFKRVRKDGRFSGFILYETYNFLKFKAGGGCEISRPEVKTLKEILSK